MNNIYQYHPADDENKVKELKKAMTENEGWVGPSLVMLDEAQAITGSHRIRALKQLIIQWEDGKIDADWLADYELPTITMKEIYGEFEMPQNYEEIMIELTDTETMILRLTQDLPYKTKIKYGIDIS
jgi:hypothetical protein